MEMQCVTNVRYVILISATIVYRTATAYVRHCTDTRYHAILMNADAEICSKSDVLSQMVEVQSSMGVEYAQAVTLAARTVLVPHTETALRTCVRCITHHGAQNRYHATPYESWHHALAHVILGAGRRFVTTTPPIIARATAMASGADWASWTCAASAMETMVRRLTRTQPHHQRTLVAILWWATSNPCRSLTMR